MSSEFVTRPLRTIAELRQAQEIIIATWGESGDSLVPVPTLVAVNHAGGLVAGAFEEETLAGFIYSFPGVIAGELILYSQMTAVRPDRRDRGIGRRLKFYQRQWALDHGFARVYWTFDPLMAVNGRFNLHYLGAAAVAYLESFYGDESFSPLHGNVPTDRFQACWDLRSPRVTALARGEIPEPCVADPGAVPVLYELTETASGSPVPAGTGEPRLGGEPWLLAPIPADFLALSRSEPEVAERWRLATRTAFQAAFQTGYTVVDLLDAALEAIPGPHCLLGRADSR